MAIINPEIKGGRTADTAASVVSDKYCNLTQLSALNTATGKSGVSAATTLIGGVNDLYGETDLDDVNTDMAVELAALNTALTAEHTTLKAAIAAAIEALSGEEE